MNIQKFNELMAASGGLLGQSIPEWRCFLEFVETYFKARNIQNPIIVEIGVMNNAQRPFYEELLNADHVGIDIMGSPDILGSSQSPVVLDELKARLSGRMIDLLFIDGDHTYTAIKSDYELYGPLTKHIIVFHDISHPYSPQIPEETMRFWNEVVEADRQNIHLTIQHYNSERTGIAAGRQMGIGMVIKQDGGGL